MSEQYFVRSLITWQKIELKNEKKKKKNRFISSSSSISCDN